LTPAFQPRLGPPFQGFPEPLVALPQALIPLVGDLARRPGRLQPLLHHLEPGCHEGRAGLRELLGGAAGRFLGLPGPLDAGLQLGRLQLRRDFLHVPRAPAHQEAQAPSEPRPAHGTRAPAPEAGPRAVAVTGVAVVTVMMVMAAAPLAFSPAPAEAPLFPTPRPFAPVPPGLLLHLSLISGLRRRKGLL